MAVTIAYFRGPGGWREEMEALGCRVIDLDLRFYGDPMPLLRLRRLIAAGGFSLVHAHLPPAELYARAALLGIPRAELPLIITKHNDCPFHRVPGECLVERWVAQRADAVICISEAVNRYMTARKVAIEPPRLITVAYGIDIAPYEAVAEAEVAALRREWGADSETMVIGFVGRLVLQKALDQLIAAFALLRKKTARKVKLVIVGRGPLQSTLQQCARAHHVCDGIVWAGFRADIPRVMRAFDVFALTSDFEGFGLVLIEAMAARRPVVATRVSAIPEVVVDGETGLLAEKRSPESIAAALERMMDPELRAEMGEAGHQRACEHFTLERMHHATDDVYARALQTPPSFNPTPGTAASAVT
jgi:glycosyltransferase involved in cell wall biosynthesis